MTAPLHISGFDEYFDDNDFLAEFENIDFGGSFSSDPVTNSILESNVMDNNNNNNNNNNSNDDKQTFSVDHEIDDFVNNILKNDSLFDESIIFTESIHLDNTSSEDDSDTATLISDDTSKIQSKTKSNMKTTQSKSIVVKKYCKPRISKSMPMERISAKDFQRYEMDVTKAFNIGDLSSIALMVNKYTHQKSLFRLKNPIDFVESIGTDHLVNFYGALLMCYPDAVLISKKMKQFNRDKFSIIQCKMDFTGTEISKGMTKSLLFCPQKNLRQSDFMITSDEEKQKANDLEDRILASGKKLRLFIKSMTTIYIDPECNRIVLTDVTYRISSFQAV